MRCCIKWPFTFARKAINRSVLSGGTILFLLLLTGGCGQSHPPAALDLPVFFTCDTRGRLEPCGCFEGQFGGLTRLKTVLDGEAGAGALRLDVGDAIGGHEDYDLLEYHYILKAFAAMNYDALNIGAREAQFSLSELRQIKQLSPVPIISANLLDQAGRRPVFDSYRIVRRGASRIAIIGVVDPRALAENPGAGLAVADMESSVDRCLGELRGRADLIVLLAFTDEATLAKLADEFYECQVILGGKVTQPAQELQRENRSFVYYVANESRALGILRLRLAPGAPVEAATNEIRLLHDKIPQDKTLTAMMQSYRDEVRHARLAVDDPGNLSADMVPGVRAVASYAGTPKCVTCHQSAAAVWTNSGHARAFNTLMARNADADPKCIGCHTVGFGSPSGYRREFGAATLVDVGCESCHGPGSLHVRQREGDTTVNFTFRPLDAGDCRKCHQGEFSRPFDWDQFWPLIKHGNEPQLAAKTPAHSP